MLNRARIENSLKIRGKKLKSLFLINKFGMKSQKSNNSDYRTSIDDYMSEVLSSDFKKIFQNISIDSEESDEEISSVGEWKCVLDPLDGTSNFVHQIPYFGISAAFYNDSNEYAFIYDPIREKMLFADPSKKLVEINGKSILHANKKTAQDNLVICIESGYEVSPKITETIKSGLWNAGVNRILSLWSPSSDYLRLFEGNVDALVIIDSGDRHSHGAGRIAVDSSEHVKKTSVNIDILNHRVPINLLTNSDNVDAMVAKIISLSYG